MAKINVETSVTTNFSFKTQFEKTSKAVFQPGNPAAKSLSGLALYPLVFIAQQIAQESLALMNVPFFSTKDQLSVIAQNLTNIPLQFIEPHFYARIVYFAGLEMTIREFAQNYLFEQKLASLPRKISPRFIEFPKTTAAKVIKIILSSCLATWLHDYHCRDRKEMANVVDDFIFNLFAGAMNQVTSSILPGIAMRVARYELLAID